MFWDSGTRLTAESWTGGHRLGTPKSSFSRRKGWPEGEVERGLDAWRRQAQRLRDTWDEARVEVDEIQDLKDQVHARIRYVTVGADTGIPFETPMAVVFFLSEGKITRGYFGWTMADALEAAGLSE